ncbi:hypothetical protein QUB36_24135 [Microcoleus sp. AT8-B1]|uniref:hypothetical protein n=1 Tax=unclassified Microcoleus TaxID=2642155 RepID=UPI002FD580EC
MSSSVLIARTLALRQGIHSLSDYWFYLKLTPIALLPCPQLPCSRSLYPIAQSGNFIIQSG